MKLPTVLLIGSLAVNAAFVAAYAPNFSSSGPNAGASRGALPAAANDLSQKNGRAGTVPATTGAEAAQLGKAWQLLQNGDIRTLADRLRAAGFPPSAVKAIVTSQVYEQFSERRKALISKQDEVPYWATQQRSVMDPKAMAELRDLGRQQMSLLKDLLGADGYLGSDEALAYQKRQYGDLARDKLEQLQNISSDYNELRQQIYQTANGVMLPEDRAKLALLEKEQRTDMAKILSGDELEAYDLRSSNTANLLRSQLGTFKPSEEEFRAIFRATRAAEDQFGSLSNITSPDQSRQIQTAAYEQLKSMLPVDRLADLKQAVDPTYQQINRLVARLELPTSAAMQVVAVQQDIQRRATAARALPAEQRNAQLTALAEEATASVTTALGGQRGLEAYKQYGGQWLQTIVPRPAPPAATPAPAR